MFVFFGFMHLSEKTVNPKISKIKKKTNTYRASCLIKNKVKEIINN